MLNRPYKNLHLVLNVSNWCCLFVPDTNSNVKCLQEFKLKLIIAINARTNIFHSKMFPLIMLSSRCALQHIMFAPPSLILSLSPSFILSFFHCSTHWHNINLSFVFIYFITTTNSPRAPQSNSFRCFRIEFQNDTRRFCRTDFRRTKWMKWEQKQKKTKQK